MSAQDFSEEQRRYLEGFVSGVQARRASQGLKPLGTEGGGGGNSENDLTQHVQSPLCVVISAAVLAQSLPSVPFVACCTDRVHIRFGHQTVVFYDCLFRWRERRPGTGLLARVRLRRYKPATLFCSAGTHHGD